MNRKVTVEKFSIKKEVAKLVLYLLLALFLGIASFLYLYSGMYFRAGFTGLGTLSWCWLSFLCIWDIKVAKKWIKKSREI